jgi:site-specific DNA-cytosine methylase
VIRVVSLFAGLGGADLGLYAAADELGLEVEVVDAIDSWEPAVRVYNAPAMAAKAVCKSMLILLARERGIKVAA